MRGKPGFRNFVVKFGRITPAHAGKTFRSAGMPLRAADHPRACGENTIEKAEFTAPSGSPPRMRGKRDPALEGFSLRRITPAHAGKTTAMSRS